MKKYTFLMMAWCVMLSTAQAEELSTVTLPLSINLDAVEKRVNSQVPKTLVSINRRQVCVPAKWAKWDYPCFRGIKMYRCEGKTKVTPQISCTIKGSIIRSDVKIGGTNSQIVVTMPVSASVTASKGSVRQSASAVANVTFKIVPKLNPDWSPELNIDPSYTWTKRPQLKLFNAIKITIAGEVDPKLEEVKNDLLKKIPTMLSELQIHKKVETAWAALQQPIEISANPKVQARFRPNTIGFSGLSIRDRNLSAKLSVSGETIVVVGKLPQRELTPLPYLSGASGKGQFRLAIPVSVRFEEAEKAIRDHHPAGYDFVVDKGFKGVLTFNDFQIGGESDGQLLINASVTLKPASGALPNFLSNWMKTKGSVTMKSRPHLNADSQSISLSDLRLSADTDSTIFNILSAVVGSQPFLNVIEGRLKYSYTEDMRRLTVEANKNLNARIEDNVQLVGSLNDARIVRLEVKADKLKITTRMFGSLQAKVGF